MRRVVCVYLPRFAADLARRGRSRVCAPEPVLVVRPVGGREEVVSCCGVCTSAGVRPGMTVAHARALIGGAGGGGGAVGVRVVRQDAERERRALRALAVWATRYTPVVAPDGPDGLTLDITGCAHLFGGERAMARDLVRALGGLGFAARAGVAGSVGCAWAVARWGRGRVTVVASGGERAALAGLPVSALRIGADAVEALGAVGVERVGELMTLPRSAVPGRFGEGVLRRLDQALGEAVEVVEGVHVRGRPVVERRFEGATTRAESVWLAVRGALEALCEEMGRRGVGALGVEVRLDRVDARAEVVGARGSVPTRSAGHLWSLIRPGLERAHLGFGVEGVSVRAVRTGRVPGGARGLWGHGAGERSERRRAVGELVDVLAGRLGGVRVCRVSGHGTHLPEGAYERVEAWSWEGVGSVWGWDRPSRLLDRPEPAEVARLTPDGAPARVRWRGSWLEVSRAEGPERVEPEWWRERSSARDYFMVGDVAGRWLWVYRELGTGRWFVHGWWG